MPSYLVPGVYRDSDAMAAPAPLATGVPAFIGFADAAPETGTPANTPVSVQRREDFAATFAAPRGSTSYLPAAVAGFFDNGGDRCYVVRVDAAQWTAAALIAALAPLEPMTDLDLIAVPDAVTLATAADIASVQDAMLEHCRKQGDRFAILDVPRDVPPADACAMAIKDQIEPINGALYYPWVFPAASAAAVPPCGHIAGIIARTDAKAGVFKAPANEPILGITNVDEDIDTPAQALLNPLGVNCLRVFPGRGIRVWGARTLSQQAEWRYVNVRRLFLTLRRWINQNMAWSVFEPNDLRLWNRITRELSAYLTSLWRGGAFAGETPADSFFVKCDAETNSPESRDAGYVVTEIGLAPGAPAEFIVVRITQQTAATT